MPTLMACFRNRCALTATETQVSKLQKECQISSLLDRTATERKVSKLRSVLKFAILQILEHAITFYQTCSLQQRRRRVYGKAHQIPS